MTARAWLLCRARIFRNGLLRSRRPGARGVLLWWLLSLAFAAGIFFSLDLFFDAAGYTARRAGEVLLALCLDAALAGLLVFDLHFAVAALLYDSDLTLLRAAPLPPGRLIAMKIADTAAYTPTLLVAIGAPACAAFLVSRGAPAWTLGLALLLLVAQWATAVTPGALGAMWLARRVESTRLRASLSLLGTLTLAAVWIGNGFLVPRLADAGTDLVAALDALARNPGALALTPGWWAGRALAAAAEGRAGAASGWSAVVLGAAVGAGALGLRWGAPRLEDAQRAASVRPARRFPPPPAGPGALSLVAAVAAKDMRLISRDWSVLGDVVASSLLWALLPLVARPLFGYPPHLVLVAALVVLACGLGYELGARSVPLERVGLALLLASPAPRGRWVLAKLASAVRMAGLVYVVAALLLALGLGVGWREALVAAAWGGMALVAALCVGLAMGLRFADFAWTNPRAMLTTAGRAVAAVALVAQVAVWVGLALWGSGAAVLAGAMAAAGAVGAIAGQARRVRRMEWV